MLLLLLPSLLLLLLHGLLRDMEPLLVRGEPSDEEVLEVWCTPPESPAGEETRGGLQWLSCSPDGHFGENSGSPLRR